MNASSRRLLLCAALISAALALVFAGSASASRELVNGFDNDYHCVGGNPDVCHLFNTILPWASAHAPDPSKPILELDRNGKLDGCPDCNSTSDQELVDSIDLAFGGPGLVSKQVVDPRSAEFAALPIDTAHYSAIWVASNVDCGGCDLNTDDAQPDSDAIALRKADIANFFRNGGGVVAFSGGSACGDTILKGACTSLPRCNHYYEFLPLPVVCNGGGGDVTVTPAGAGIGLIDADYGGSHNAFEPPDASSPLQVGAVLSGDNSDARGGGGPSVPGQPQTLFSDSANQPTIGSAASAATCAGSFTSSDPGGSGTKSIHYKAGGGAEVAVNTDPAGNASVAFPQGTTSVEFWAEDQAGNQEASHHTLSLSGCAKPAAPTIGVAGVRRACTSASSIHVRFSVHAPGKVKSVKVTLDGKKLKTTSKSRFTLRINLKKLKAGHHKLRTVVTDQAGNTKRSTRTIARCAAAKPRRQAGPRFTG
jgi:Bacterial Ig domain